ncbi:hypothetical protein [Actinomadura sp. 3N508]|uniref:hypothetical protein n=1 Tax=Actinomadura sp. 3N508 TaxID=3375153 RepID=UPI0037B2A9F6
MKDEALPEKADRTSPLWKSLQTLTNGLGVQRLDLYKSGILSQELCELWHIDLEHDSPATVQAKVIWQVEQLFEGMPSNSRTAVVKVCFNLADKEGRTVKGNLSARQEDLGKRPELGGRGAKTGPSKSTIQRYLNEAIDTFWLELRRKPSPPMPEDVIPKLRMNNDETKESSATSTPPSPPKTVSKRTIYIALPSLAIGATVAVLAAFIINSQWQNSNEPATGSSPKPAPSSALPLHISSITEMRSESGDGSFVLPGKLTMSQEQLTTFNDLTVPSTEGFAKWYTDHKGAAVDFGFTNITVRGNAKGVVRITDVRVIKECNRPLTGTYFQGFKQGEGDTIGLAFDLDDRDPIPQEMASTAMEGLKPLDRNYFASKVITLKPGEEETLSVGAYTKQYACKFRLRAVMSTPDGPQYQDISYHGKPFEVTATAPSPKPGVPYAAYQAAYAVFDRGGVRNWERVNPATYRKP